ncbi:hypothetical protein QE152_g12530 [Popillia japonica]|uniref:Tf2-1-like SH3-like domain-containing protein n=1 Tax=Popillia japonica TaxID=7064 RepID=A0AAW1LRF9_POPJA
MKSVAYSTGESTKLQPRYRGPYKVIQVLPSDTYRIASLQKETARTTTAHVSQLKIWKCEPDDDEDEIVANDEDEEISDENKHLNENIKDKSPIYDEARKGG